MCLILCAASNFIDCSLAFHHDRHCAMFMFHSINSFLATVVPQVHFGTMESRVRPGMYLAGEVLDVDGVTGGYNFQSAWTTGHIAGNQCARSLVKDSAC